MYHRMVDITSTHRDCNTMCGSSSATSRTNERRVPIGGGDRTFPTPVKSPRSTHTSRTIQTATPIVMPNSQSTAEIPDMTRQALEYVAPVQPAEHMSEASVYLHKYQNEEQQCTSKPRTRTCSSTRQHCCTLVYIEKKNNLPSQEQMAAGMSKSIYHSHTEDEARLF